MLKLVSISFLCLQYIFWQQRNYTNVDIKINPKKRRSVREICSDIFFILLKFLKDTSLRKTKSLTEVQHIPIPKRKSTLLANRC